MPRSRTQIAQRDGRTVPRIVVGDQATQRAIDNIRSKVNEPERENVLSGVRHLNDTELADATVVKLRHGLGRKLKGWVVTDIRGPAANGRIERVTSDGGSTANDERDLWLKATDYGATITVRLLVY